MASGADNPGEGGGGGGGTTRAPPTPLPPPPPPPAPATSSRPRSGKEGHHRAVSWYARKLVSLGIKSHGDPGQAFTPMRYSSGPSSQQSSHQLMPGLTYDPLLGVVLVSSEEYLSSGFFEDILDKAKGPFIGIADQFNRYMDMWDDAKGVYKNFSEGPGLYKHIGRDAKGLLLFDYSSDMLRLDPTNMSNLVCGAGVTSDQNFPLRKLFLSLKHANTVFDLNGTVNDSLLAKISFDGVLGANTRGVLYLPLPSFKSKFEFQSFHRFAGLSGGFGTGIRPCHEVSCLLGAKLFSFGGALKYNPLISEWSSSGGISVQIPNASIGLTVSQDLIATATVFRSYPKWRTSFGILASFGLGGPSYPLVPYFAGPCYCPVPRRVHRHHVPRRVEEENDPVPRRIEDSAIIVGVSHQLNDQVLLKSRVSSDGVVSVLVKLTFWGVLSVAASADVDCYDLYRVPSAGFVVSVH